MSVKQKILLCTEDARALLLAGITIVLIVIIALSAPSFKFPVPVYKWKNTEDLIHTVAFFGNLSVVFFITFAFFILYLLFLFTSGIAVKKNIFGFLVLFLFAILSQIVAGNKTVSLYGLEYVVFALLFGLALNYFFKLPSWIKEAAQSEFFIKTGLVLLGCSVLFKDILKAGLPGMLQALLVVLVVWFFAFWLSKKLNLDDEYAVILSSAVSICGVSAAIVAAGAINGDKKKLSYISALVLIVAIPMLVIQPYLIRYFEIPEAVGGAWLGGTLDTTASVTAASELVGNEALQVGVIVKFSQNVLIGLAAFFITSWWVLRAKEGETGNGKPSYSLLWQRFPKFVLGFIAASLIFSFVLSVERVQQTGAILSVFRTTWFALAFVSIGIETDLKTLIQSHGGRPAVTFIIAQLFNILWTLLIAWLLFGGILFSSLQS
ncbi:MAG TPA: putative sulfate exporter family transporter [Lacibacter sp.]|nr:putative sulfate exporter family transporter [Lacibacter sp.]HMO87760.1 putative sulfate exporter family transporter [Lacibacter sp.]HMP85688.1 putative sulfate exporter family transporter [Lacibacter sp.]